MKSSRKRSRRGRKLNVQALESRQLLAADIGLSHNHDLPEDVSGDGAVSSIDALMVVNGLQQEGDASADRRFRDVNNDGRMTSSDALRIINRIGQDRIRGNDGRGNDAIDDGSQGDDQDVTETEVRSIDGTGNNLENPELGSTGIELRRLVDSDYADGISEPSGEDRLSAREISNIVAAQDESIPNDRNLSDIVWQWGQFLDHDITLTAEGEGEEFNIQVPTGDEFFDPFNTGVQEISLTRSGVAEGTGIDSPAEQVNNITAFIDGSMVYGSDQATADSLRSFEGGRLATSEGDLLPIDENSGFFMAGDVRANEQNGLTSLHTLWVREHNRVADEIAAEDPSLSDEDIYQQARNVVIGEIQAITYNEYLPALLGRGALDRYEGYDSTVDPSISNLFASAAFRYGHTSLSSELLRLDNDGNVIEEGNLALRDAFFNPSGILELGIDPLLKGLSSNVAQEIDTQLVDDVRNFLFGPPGAGGFDLAALNIQRGRDHGLPDYNSVREQLGLAPAETFADISSDPSVQAKLEAAYGTVDDIDVWVGSLAEDHVNGGSLGETASTVLIEQFTALRDGDRFWYQNVFEGQELREIEQTRLSDVIERNTELTSIQNNAFIVPSGDADQPDQDRPDGPRPDRPGGQDIPGDNVGDDGGLDGQPPRPPRGGEGPDRPQPDTGNPPPTDQLTVDGQEDQDDMVVDGGEQDGLLPRPPRGGQGAQGPQSNAGSPPPPVTVVSDQAGRNDRATTRGLDTESVDEVFGSIGRP